MQGWQNLLFIATIAASPSAIAATELHGGPGLAGGMRREASAVDARDYLTTLDALGGRFHVEASAADGPDADDGTFVLDDRLFDGRSEAARGAATHDRYRRVILLIAFAGLTALFGRKRSGGRGLIAV